MNPCITALLRGRSDATTPEMLLLLLLVASHDKDHDCEGSFEWLSKLHGSNERNVKLLVAKLRKKGLLLVSKTSPASGHSQNVYRVATCNWPFGEKVANPGPKRPHYPPTEWVPEADL